MPLTFSHPAAVLPLLREPFVPAALVAGSLAPDLPYYLDVPVSAQDWYGPFLNATETHSLTGLLTLDLVITGVLLAVVVLVRRPVLALLPTRRVPPATPPRPSTARPTGRQLPRRAFWLLVSALIGVASHLLWDAFTHADGHIVTHVAILRFQVADGLPAFRLLQHLSTAGGALVLAWWLRRWWRQRPPAAPVPTTPHGLTRGARRAVLTGLSLCVAAGVGWRFVGLAGEDGARLDLEHALTHLVTAGAASLACATAFYALTWWTVHWARRAAAGPRPAGRPETVGQGPSLR
ncbi:DUF4184 family protein [Streptomyces sp. 549]|uniref:DUF4184 family protein n=1 Tax=Streptomyces sp. 549 TaxID=3049076 RepID=UPI0024C23594|nr:DUF4184 family protein [Streptomyces sp. 549]MDK1475835.1 DUF4184 family protein [Streptomyces sp. 549]